MDNSVATSASIYGKLLARKRPKLIPVYDSIVSCQFGAPKHVWMKLHGRFTENDGGLRSVLAAARTTVTLFQRPSSAVVGLGEEA